MDSGDASYWEILKALPKCFMFGVIGFVKKILSVGIQSWCGDYKFQNKKGDD